MVELEGPISEERDLDADAGALLVCPKRIVSVAPLDPAVVEAIRGRMLDDSNGEPGLEGLCADAPNEVAMRAMALIWAVILIGGITYFSVIGLTHH